MREPSANPYAASSQIGSDASSESKYSVRCSCGRAQAVQAAQAGSEVSCVCGTTLDVPSLSSLRLAVGENAIPQNTIERIRGMVRGNELPTGVICSCCGRVANDTIVLRVQCERSSVRGGRSMFDSVVMAVGSALTLHLVHLLHSWEQRPPEKLGRDSSVNVPVRIWSDCRRRIERSRSQRKLKKLLADTPVYRELLAEYPRAIITPIPSKSGPT